MLSLALTALAASFYAITFGGVAASPTLAQLAQVKRSVHELQDSYDYVIIGGGTSGLTVANRLTEDPDTTVLVVELGYFGDEACIWMPVNSVSTASKFGPCLAHHFNDTTVPQPGLNNASLKYLVGAVVGGSSAVNGMFFDRGTKADYDAWESLGNPGWGWDGLFPYFKKSVKFTPPSEKDAEKYGYTWDTAAYGEDSPIQATLSRWQWNTTLVMWDAWDDFNITGPKEHAFGDGIGRFWVPASQDPVNQTRSYARYGYHDPIKERPNYHLLIGHKAEKILFTEDMSVKGVVIYDRTLPEEKFNVKANKETIIATGAAHTPQLLELSGVGDPAVLKAAGIEVKAELPGVGNNFQDHPQARIICNFTKDFWPNSATLQTNDTFFDEALAEFNAHRTGPLTLALGNSAVFFPLRMTHSSPDTYLSKLQAQADDEYLPSNYPEAVVAGYGAQKRVLAQLYSSPNATVYEMPFAGGCTRTMVINKPLSRGTIHIDTRNLYGQPLIDFRVFSNPLDVELAIEFIKYTRKYIDTPTLAPLSPVEIGPGPNVSSSDTAAMETWVHASSGPTSFHVSGTAAMMPKELGGVVGPDLKVYGIKGLRIVDASIIPLIPSTHLSATVYAIAEKAADIIKSSS